MRRNLIRFISLMLAAACAMGCISAVAEEPIRVVLNEDPRDAVYNELGVCSLEDFAHGSESASGLYKGLDCWQIPWNDGIALKTAQEEDMNTVWWSNYQPWFLSEGIIAQIDWDLDGDGKDEWLVAYVKNVEGGVSKAGFRIRGKRAQLHLRVYELKNNRYVAADDICIDECIDAVGMMTKVMITVSGGSSYIAVQSSDHSFDGSEYWLLFYENGFRVHTGIINAHWNSMSSYGEGEFYNCYYQAGADFPASEIGSIRYNALDLNRLSNGIGTLEAEMGAYGIGVRSWPLDEYDYENHYELFLQDTDPERSADILSIYSLVQEDGDYTGRDSRYEYIHRRMAKAPVLDISVTYGDITDAGTIRASIELNYNKAPDGSAGNPHAVASDIVMCVIPWNGLTMTEGEEVHVIDRMTCGEQYRCDVYLEFDEDMVLKREEDGSVLSELQVYVSGNNCGFCQYRAEIDATTTPRAMVLAMNMAGSAFTNTRDAMKRNVRHMDDMLLSCYFDGMPVVADGYYYDNYGNHYKRNDTGEYEEIGGVNPDNFGVALDSMLMDIADDADENDLTYIYLNAHGPVYNNKPLPGLNVENVIAKQEEGGPTYYHFIPYAKIFEMIEERIPGRVIIMIDSCYSGTAVETAKQMKLDTEKYAIITASTDIAASDTVGLLIFEMGYFTKTVEECVYEAADAGKEVLTFGEVTDYVRKKGQLDSIVEILEAASYDIFAYHHDSELLAPFIYGNAGAPMFVLDKEYRSGRVVLIPERETIENETGVTENELEYSYYG